MGQASSLGQKVDQWLENLKVGFEDGFTGAFRPKIDPNPTT